MKVLPKVVTKTFLFTLFTLALFQMAFGQFLHYNKLGHRMQANYKINDEITFDLKETGDIYSGIITGFTDSTIVFKNYEFRPDEISHVYVDSKIVSNYMFKYKWPRIFIVSGLGYTGLELLNYGTVNGGTIFEGLALVQAGLLIQLLTRKKLPVNDRYSLTIINKINSPLRAPDQAN